MNKNTFSLIIVPHDHSKTRTYNIPYRLFYVLVGFLCVGTVAVVIFVATYGRVLMKAREAARLEIQVVELTKRTEQIGELRRRLAELHAMDLKVRQMLGLDMAPDDSIGLSRTQVAEGVLVEGGNENDTEQMLRAIPSFWPVRGYITKGFNIAGGPSDEQYHPGIDIAVPRGTPVRAAAAGYVTEARWDDTYGYLVRIDHGYGIKTVYGHNDRLAVHQGERVGRGQTIAWSGNSGRSTAPHLHFEVTKDNVQEDPLKYLLK
jgi:murein DD-endopeptidase MepM/ murein hydrolase activator NlpD